MRWLTLPLHREADVSAAGVRVRAWADATGLTGLERSRVVTVGAELARCAADTRDGTLEFGWERRLERPFCAIDTPSYAQMPDALVDEARASDGRASPLRFEVMHEGTRARYLFLADRDVPAEVIQRAVAEPADATTIELLREQNLEMARMLGKLRDREAELARALDAAQRLLAIAAHDIRSPVAAAKGALELLEPTLHGLTPDQKHLLGVARRAADSVVHLVGNLMAAALIERDDDEVSAPILDFAAVVREVVELMEVQARHKGVSFSLDVADVATTVRGDLMWTRQIVANVVNNAVKFTPRGGHVRVNVGRADASVALVVEDDGVGIPAEHAERAFERLTKLRPRGTAGERGTGIGLFVTKQLVDRLGGTITLAPRAPTGARFEVRIPFVEGVAAPLSA